jgi:hypothetical protein
MKYEFNKFALKKEPKIWCNMYDNHKIDVRTIFVSTMKIGFNCFSVDSIAELLLLIMSCHILLLSED